jgi:cell division septation protein DedD
MDQNIPLDQRQQAAGLAVEMQKKADATRGRVLAAADLGVGADGGPGRAVAAAPAASAPVPAKVAVSPSVAAARAAVAEAREATGTASPAEAGASFARRPAQPVRVAAAPSPKPAPPKPKQEPLAAAAVAKASGPWRVQLGAFSVRGNVDKLWARLSGRDELAGHAKLTIPAGAVTKLQAGGFASRDAAETACRSLRQSGHECLVTR